MSKSVLIINTPKHCRECPAYEYNVPSSTCYCNAVHDDIGYARPARKLNKPAEYNFPIQDWCPLSPLPERINLCQYVDNAALNMDSILAYQYTQGYNDFREEILKGET